MKPVFEEDTRESAALEVARKMMAAARTAPKAKGIDTLVIALLDRNSIKEVSDEMKKIYREKGLSDSFLRDAVNILSADAMVVMGTRIQSMRLDLCGMCGFESCAEKNENSGHPCVFNTGDLGIAMGSAVSVAMDCRVDSRIMYTVGQAVLKMKIFDEDVKVAYGIPVSISGKNPFFDRNMEKMVRQA